MKGSNLALTVLIHSSLLFRSTMKPKSVSLLSHVGGSVVHPNICNIA